jgi:hypothetical protein
MHVAFSSVNSGIEREAEPREELDGPLEVLDGQIHEDLRRHIPSLLSENTCARTRTRMRTRAGAAAQASVT